jgi:hypothetical protein
MKDLNHGLDLLADEATPAPVDVYDVIAKAKARTRNRRATAATALATVILAGAVIATTSPGAGQSAIQVGAPPVSPTTIAWSPPAGPTMTSHAVDDDQMVTFTEQLADVWPTVVPQGVTTEKLSWFASGTLAPLEFRGFRTELPPDSVTYATAAALSDSLGSNELLIHVTQVGPDDWPFTSLQPQTDAGTGQTLNSPYDLDSTHNLPDGTRVQIVTQGSPAFQRFTEVVRPDGTAIRITENNSPGRPDFILGTEDLLKIATAISYS